MEIATWLASLGLAQYTQAFADNAIDAEILPHLTADDLREMGVVAVGHRRRLLEAIAALQVRAEPRPAGAGERREVIVLFADLAGYTALSRELDAEDVHALLGRYFERVDRIVEEHGGRVDKHVGDCVMAVFGAPLAYGNEPERAARAALAVLDAMPAIAAETGRAVDAHVGIAGGQVVASGTGSTSHHEYTVTGDTVNLAARLTDSARGGEILVSDAVRRALGDRFDGDELAPLALKGIGEPARAWRLRRLLPTAPRRTPLVGRERELEQLRRALTECRASGRGQAIHIRGEAGIGKTRLLEEFRADALRAGFACHTGLVLDFGAGTGRDAVRALVRAILGLTEASAPDEAARAAEGGRTAGLVDPDDAVFLNDLLDIPQPSGLRALYDAMAPATREAGRRLVATRLVERASRRRPLVLQIEDLHWADPATVAHVADLVHAVCNCPLILVTTSRPEGDPFGDRAAAEQSDGAAPVIDLGPLDMATARALAEPFLAGDAARAERCIARAAGNPLYLEQLLRHAEETAEEGMPGSVRSLLQARLDRLARRDKAALQAAAVLGQRFDLATLRHLLDRPDYDARELLTRRLIAEHGGGFLFAHALVRDAAYDGLLRARRRELHRRAADWFDGRDAVLRAEHLDRAGDVAPAAEAYLAAASAQAAEYRHETALRLVDRGLELASAGDTRFELAYANGEILHDLGRMRAALAAYERAFAEATDDARRCRAWLGLATVKRTIDDLAGASADLDRAEMVAVDHGLVAERARVHVLRGNLCFPRGDIDGCLREHGRALELARRARLQEQEAAALGGLGDAAYMQGRMVSAHEAFRQCVELCQENGLGRIELANRPMLALTRWFAGDTRGALAEALTAVAAAERAAQRRACMVAHHAAYFCCHSLLDLAGARTHAEAAEALARELSARRFEAEAIAFRAELCRLSGNQTEALAAAAEALAICRETGMTFLGPYVLGLVARTTADPAERDTALAEGEALLAAGAVSHNHFLFRRDALEACLQVGAWDEAERHALALERYDSAERSQWTLFVAARGRALAAYGRGVATPVLVAELARVRAAGERLGHRDALPALNAALSDLAASAPPS